MACSMTGFASSQALADPFRLVWELRSVNHRFLEIGIRLPGELRPLEPACRAQVGAALSRGKVDCTLTLTRISDHGHGPELREEAIQELLSLQARVRELVPGASPLSVGEVLRWQGAVKEAVIEPSAVEAGVSESLEAALKALVEAREREGGRLTAAIRERCLGMKGILDTMRPRIGLAEERFRTRLLRRLEQLAVDADLQRLEQELAQVAQRLDISEEIDRLNSHMDEVDTILSRDGPMGRRLDFLLQELNREANTLASKSQDKELTRGAVELKVLIEQMREQVQNLE